MADSVNIMTRLSEWLGPELFSACRQNDVMQVEALTSTSMESSKWSAAMLAAASEKSAEVAKFCMKNTRNKLNTLDSVGKWVLGNQGLEEAYQFLVDSNLVDPEHRLEHTGQLLGLLAGSSRERPRHALVKYLLDKNVNPNQRVEMYGEVYALAAAAAWSDQQMLGLLLDHGATLIGSGALIYAAKKGREENVRYLLDRGANVNEMVPLEESLPGLEAACTALHAAIENGHTGLVDVLIKAGADTQVKDAQGRTAAAVAKANGMDEKLLGRMS